VNASVYIAGNHNITSPPLTPPQGISITADPWLGTTLIKAGDGDLLEDDDDQRWHGVVFVGKRARGTADTQSATREATS